MKTNPTQKKSFQDQMLDLNKTIEQQEIAQQEILDSDLATAEKADKENELAFLDEIFEQGLVKKEDVERWKEMYSNKIFLSYFDKDEYYFYRYISLPEWKSIMTTYQGIKTKTESLFDELLVEKCLLYPAFTPELKALVPGGTFSTLSKQIQFSSNFLPDDVTIRMITKV